MDPNHNEVPEGLIRKVLLGDDTLRAVRGADGRVKHYAFRRGGGVVDADTFEGLRANDLVREAHGGLFGWLRPKAWGRSGATEDRSR
jgi:hypothetical protein